MSDCLGGCRVRWPMGPLAGHVSRARLGGRGRAASKRAAGAGCMNGSLSLHMVVVGALCYFGPVCVMVLCVAGPAKARVLVGLCAAAYAVGLLSIPHPLSPRRVWHHHRSGSPCFVFGLRWSSSFFFFLLMRAHPGPRRASGASGQRARAGKRG